MSSSTAVSWKAVRMPSASLSESASRSDGASQTPIYSVYGTRIATDMPLRSLRPVPGGPADLSFELRDHPPALEWPGLRSDPEPRVPGSFYLERHGCLDVLSLPGVCDLYFWPERIVCYLRDWRYEASMELLLLGTVMSYWLERHGIAALHASAVEVDGSAVAFLASNGGGKTSLGVTFTQRGHPLVTDDILAVEHRENGFRARTGYPQLRLWPAQARALLGSCDGFEYVHPSTRKYRVPVGQGFGSFAEGALPLAVIYLPERQSGRVPKIDITPASPRQALKELLRNSFVPRLAEGAVLPGDRLLRLGALVRQVPVRRLRYPDGVRHLPAVRAAILDDLRRTPQGMNTCRLSP